jgi:hypothetical protein
MNTINMPGFTAETSLYETSKHYQSTTSQTYSNGEQVGISQLRPRVAVAPPGGGDGVPDCAVCFGICVAICVFTNVPNCVDFCYDLCGCPPIPA